MTDLNWDFLIGFAAAWFIQAARWSYDKWRTTRALQHAMRTNPSSVLASLAELRDRDNK